LTMVHRGHTDSIYQSSYRGQPRLP